jgi:hypothetical protein
LDSIHEVLGSIQHYKPQKNYYKFFKKENKTFKKLHEQNTFIIIHQFFYLTNYYSSINELNNLKFIITVSLSGAMS